MRVTVLGKSPSWQDAGGACSGYLVQHDGHTVLLDCGNGVFGSLREHVDYGDVDAVLITHLHADHFFDVIPYSYALRYGVRVDAPRPKLFVPPDAIACLRTIGGCLGDEGLVQSAFEVAEYDPADSLSLGPLRARFCPVPHFVPTNAVELTAAGTGRFTFGADCRPNDALARFAAGTDLLLAEATARVVLPEEQRGHLTPREAGEIGRAAAARRLVLTHFSDEVDADWIRAEGAAGFGGEVDLARAGAVLEPAG